uniref:Uncharacterized protein n=1 Tax=Labrus bergylta TaxID=56723 RepID=A0A3Q3FNW6_9LABR
MSVTMTKAEGCFTPICQILKGLCYSPICCSVSQHLKKLQGSSQSVLGVTSKSCLVSNQLYKILLLAFIESPTFNLSSYRDHKIGGVCTFIMCGCSYIEIFLLQVILNVILNLSGVAFSIAAIVLYSINISDIWLWWMCENNHYYNYDYNRHTSTTPSPDKTKSFKRVTVSFVSHQMLLRSINAVLIVLSVLEFCVVISTAVLGIKALCFIQKREKNKVESTHSVTPTASLAAY